MDVVRGPEASQEDVKHACSTNSDLLRYPYAKMSAHPSPMSSHAELAAA
jgi:hypothetical protein